MNSETTVFNPFKDIDPNEYLQYLKDIDYHFDDDGKELLGILLEISFYKDELGNPNNYNRFNEFRQARKHKCKLFKVGGGSDAYEIDNPNNTKEFKYGKFKGFGKNGKLKSHSVSYNGTSRYPTIEEQERECRKKIMRDGEHIWDFADPTTGEFKMTIKIKNVDIVDLLLSKQLESWRKTTNKDNRINANISTKMLDDNNVPYEQILY